MNRVNQISKFALLAFFVATVISQASVAAESVPGEPIRQVKSALKLFDNGKLSDSPQVVSLENEPATIEVGERIGVYNMKFSVNITRMGTQTNGREDLKVQMYLARQRGGNFNEMLTTILMVSGSTVQLPLSEKDHLYFTLNTELVPN